MFVFRKRNSDETLFFQIHLELVQYLWFSYLPPSELGNCGPGDVELDPVF